MKKLFCGELLHLCSKPLAEAASDSKGMGFACDIDWRIMTAAAAAASG